MTGKFGKMGSLYRYDYCIIRIMRLRRRMEAFIQPKCTSVYIWGASWGKKEFRTLLPFYNYCVDIGTGIYRGKHNHRLTHGIRFAAFRRLGFRRNAVGLTPFVHFCSTTFFFFFLMLRIFSIVNINTSLSFLCYVYFA
jgi:hypothetical protein